MWYVSALVSVFSLEFNTRNPESSQSTTSRNTSGESQLSAGKILGIPS